MFMCNKFLLQFYKFYYQCVIAHMICTNFGNTDV